MPDSAIANYAPSGPASSLNVQFLTIGGVTPPSVQSQVASIPHWSFCFPLDKLNLQASADKGGGALQAGKGYVCFGIENAVHLSAAGFEACGHCFLGDVLFPHSL